jgi:hypothetical protein
VGTTSWKVDPPLLCGVTFYWKVAAVHDGAQGSFSSPYSFTTNAGRC